MRSPVASLPIASVKRTLDAVVSGNGARALAIRAVLAKVDPAVQALVSVVARVAPVGPRSEGAVQGLAGAWEGHGACASGENSGPLSSGRRFSRTTVLEQTRHVRRSWSPARPGKRLGPFAGVCQDGAWQPQPPTTGVGELNLRSRGVCSELLSFKQHKQQQQSSSSAFGGHLQSVPG